MRDTVADRRTANIGAVAKKEFEDEEMTGAEESGLEIRSPTKESGQLLEVLIDTTIEESSFLVNSTPVRQGRVMAENEIVPSVETPPRAATPEQSEVGQVSTMEVMRQKLQSLMNDLTTASLTRAEVNEFEDMFMDAKEKLYRAARRGRAESS
jgi:hypothetical protein